MAVRSLYYATLIKKIVVLAIQKTDFMIASLFAPLSLSELDTKQFISRTIGQGALINFGEFPDLTGVKVAIFGVSEERFHKYNRGTSMGLYPIRKQLYGLYEPDSHVKMADLGDLILGETTEDTLYAVRMIVTELVKIGVVPIVLGAQIDVSLGVFWGFEQLERMVDAVFVDATFDLMDNNKTEKERPFLNRVITHNPNYLFNLKVLGYQRYLTDPDQLEVMEKLFFDAVRLGDIRFNIAESEPLIRSADLLNFNLRAIKASDAPGNRLATTNGFAGQEACQLCRYAGFAEKLSAIGFYEYNPHEDTNNLTAQLTAQLIWHFLDGFCNRFNELPSGDSPNFIKYITTINNGEYEIIFYKSKKSSRWWMEVPIQSGKNGQEKIHLVPSSYNDYQTAMQADLPDLWIRSYQKYAQLI